ncbi:hypothetical protein [Orientia tsutsugamushi]|uniref:Repeat-containing protein D n=1 Tax=Orientia tsutsugamushi TaxID=784 RepID=A0A2U3RTB1_ORITS|nr:hypothetical protein [Orientia tsutsugamushi]KJV52681.1 hypothetical protein OTSKARP_1314 [Orientia tsutsugamushi str. Karp]SPR16464.1 repeat-containing protein D [Orientia tsutsugamushi]
MPYGEQDNLYTFNQYLDNKDNLGTKLLEAYPCSKKFLSQIFQWCKKCIYSSKNFDKFVYNLNLYNLEKLLQPARLIEVRNITSMIGDHHTVKLDILGDTLTELTSNIDILKNLYDLHIFFSTISGRYCHTGSATPGHLKNIFEGFKQKMKNWPGNTYEEKCKQKAYVEYVLNFLKKSKLKSYDINSSNYDVDNNITNQTTIKQNPFDLYIANNNKLEGYSCSMKFFFREIFQKPWKSTFTNEDFDDLISSIQLDNLEKLLSPARIIEPSNITCMLLHNHRLDILALKKTLKVLTLNINMLKALYDLEIPFSTISGKLITAKSEAADLLTEIFKSLAEMIKVHKNDEENLISFYASEPTLASAKDKCQKDLLNIINSAFNKININRVFNKININRAFNKINSIDKHSEDDIETNSDEISTHSDSQELANISDSMLITAEKEAPYCYEGSVSRQNKIYLEEDDIENSSNEINTSNLELDDILELGLDMYDTRINKILTEAANISTVNNQSQPIEGYQENNIENLQIIREMHTEEVMQSVEKRKSCYDDHEDHSYACKRQCDNSALNRDHDTEVALDKPADSINAGCHTFGTISHLAGESICILSSDTE